MSLFAHFAKAAINVGKATADGLAQRHGQVDLKRRRRRRKGEPPCMACGAVARVEAAKTAVAGGNLFQR